MPSNPLRTSLLSLTLAAALGAGCGSGQASGPRPPFDDGAALELVKYQTDLGPRVPGSEAHRLQLEWMEQMLAPLAGVVQRQPFTAWDPFSQENINCANLVASFYPEKTQRIMLCAHWDSRPVADAEEPQVAEPIIGAVDGAAGTAVMLQLARILAEHEPAYGVDIVLFDAEDLGVGGGDLTYFFQGSRHFSTVAKQTGYAPWFAILVDLIGDKQATYKRESISLDYAPEFVKMVWDLAAELGESDFIQDGSTGVTDDHWILNREARIPAIDITEGIEDYPYWHTRQDTFDKVSAASIGSVGRVLVALLYP